MKETCTCKACNLQYEIIEKPISFRGGRDMETAECPKCGTEIYRGKTYSQIIGNDIFTFTRQLIPNLIRYNTNTKKKYTLTIHYYA
jgi:predicted RNA-binding Zn-ribbon protein involved in translation (DUF1610 family)